MKKLFLLMLLFTVLCGAEAQGLQRPKLVVGIVVDQMRWDYLYRFYDRYSAGGFKRLLREGFSCENTLSLIHPLLLLRAIAVFIPAVYRRSMVSWATAGMTNSRKELCIVRKIIRYKPWALPQLPEKCHQEIYGAIPLPMNFGWQQISEARPFPLP
jgi:hypothetical protein